MKQNIYIAALLAGILALAGCGGGSSSAPATEVVEGKTADGNDGDKTGMTDTGPKTLVLGTGNTIDGKVHGGTYNLAAGDKDVEIGGVYFSCPDGGEGCVVIVSDDRRSNSVTYTGAMPTVSATKTPAVVNTQTNPRQGDSNDPLSSANLLAAVLKNTPFGTLMDGAATFMLLDKTKIKIWLDSVGVTGTTTKDDNYIYYGIWTETADGGNLPDEDKPKAQRNWRWGGSMPYGAKPDASLTANPGDTAIYSGKALLHYKVGDDGDWKQSRETENTVSLKANFAGGWINGHVMLGNSDITGANDGPDRINLKTAMYSSDIFNGTAEFAKGGPDTIKGKGNGIWKGQFFGDSSLTIDGGTQKHQAPSHVAGEFSVSRNKGTDIDALSITGVFGAGQGS